MDVARRAVDAFNRHDVDGFFAELATPDVEWWPAVARAYEGGCYQGREGVERYAADRSENRKELQSVPEEFRDPGDRVLVLGRHVGRGKGSGVRSMRHWRRSSTFAATGSGASERASIAPGGYGWRGSPSRRRTQL